MVNVTHKYGKNAGKIWNVLNEHGSMTERSLKRKTGLNGEDLYAGLGWLAKENKITFENNYYSLGEYNWNETVGKNAGKVWDVLNSCEEIDTTYVPKLADISELDFYYAMGWLAKEGKINAKKVKPPKSITKIERKY